MGGKSDASPLLQINLARTHGQWAGATGCSFDSAQPAPGRSDAAAADARHSCRWLPSPRVTGLYLRQRGSTLQDSVVNVVGGGLSSGMDALPPCWLKPEGRAGG